MCRPLRDHSIHIDLQVAREFSYNELSAATSNFSRDRKLGAGSFGEVYKGELQDPRMPPVVAVKKLTRLMEQTSHCQDFVTEVNTLSQLSHRNLVKLLGWCSGGELLLVYELVTNGSLEEHLHGSERLLSWRERYKIVLCVGAAIDYGPYLHNGYRNRILHRDIKPSNVMLDDAFDAKLGDFGLVRQLVDPEQGSLGGTGMIGTRVYMDPICITSHTVSTASDMYSFGVLLLLEIAAGMKPDLVQGAARGDLSNTLVEAVRESYARGAVLDMADKRLKGNFNSSQMELVLAVGRLCVELERQHRPNIKRAVNLLSDLSLPLL
ncbi:L-type lectin-domain containing receptor kinase IX.1 [Setaria viridis]|uniref:L-type lectin-domain containing receptor kinase IX.1 n=1 Tax=Setaria viridis TaxID=4556 RepID=UPI001493D610|nr:L-type lectin-domain containing receptor kinase IX.1-like [Setaria viridis]